VPSVRAAKSAGHAGGGQGEIGDGEEDIDGSHWCEQREHPPVEFYDPLRGP
jgi:hypothetical protein